MGRPPPDCHGPVRHRNVPSVENEHRTQPHDKSMRVFSVRSSCTDGCSPSARPGSPCEVPVTLRSTPPDLVAIAALALDRERAGVVGPADQQQVIHWRRELRRRAGGYARSTGINEKPRGTWRSAGCSFFVAELCCDVPGGDEVRHSAVSYGITVCHGSIRSKAYSLCVRGTLTRDVSRRSILPHQRRRGR